MTTPGFRPQTRWCPPHPLSADRPGLHAGTRRSSGSLAHPSSAGSGAGWATSRLGADPAGERPGGKIDTGTGAVLLESLDRDIRRRQWRVAIRRFFMLQGSGCEVPSAQRAVCEDYVGRCPPRDLRKIVADVNAWLDLVGAS